ncbi:hypothetical protein GW17_00044500 [Ensete ventricosum]|nr:hypothetical protein GW17_00044500 [Ensete ventricosum]
MRSAQRWLQLRASEATAEAVLEEKGRWWPATGAGKEEGVRREEGKAAVKDKNINDENDDGNNNKDDDVDDNNKDDNYDYNCCSLFSIAYM